MNEMEKHCMRLLDYRGAQYKAERGEKINLSGCRAHHAQSRAAAAAAVLPRVRAATGGEASASTNAWETATERRGEAETEAEAGAYAAVEEATEVEAKVVAEGEEGSCTEAAAGREGGRAEEGEGEGELEAGMRGSCAATWASAFCRLRLTRVGKMHPSSSGVSGHAAARRSGRVSCGSAS